ncbi:hypothetical protein OIE66_30695 [Nonomuraea sp. NBC_01738]|nr:hypothetical protein OIE66_30695 [Nonomuraea sp. NBC_01738]
MDNMTIRTEIGRIIYLLGTRLNDERADRQRVAEQVLSRLRRLHDSL